MDHLIKILILELISIKRIIYFMPPKLTTEILYAGGRVTPTLGSEEMRAEGLGSAQGSILG